MNEAPGQLGHVGPSVIPAIPGFLDRESRDPGRGRIKERLQRVRVFQIPSPRCDLDGCLEVGGELLVENVELGGVGGIDF